MSIHLRAGFRGTGAQARDTSVGDAAKLTGVSRPRVAANPSYRVGEDETMASEGSDNRGAQTGALLHSIGDAANLTGVSRSLLRLWEREGLVTPQRTPGGHRLYSSDDLARLRQIARLRRVDRLNIAAIRRELGPDTVPTPPPNAGLRSVGQRLRALRTARGLSLATVAEQSGLSISFLSAVERGQSRMSVANLFKLADAYGTTVPALGTDHPTEQRAVLHPSDRPHYVAGGGRVVIEDLIATPGALEAQHVQILPGGGSEEPYAHPGEELVYVLTGSLIFWINERERYRLEPGDALHFRSTEVHRWRNEGDEPVSIVWVNVPLVQESETSTTRHGASHRHHLRTQPGDAP